MGKKNRNNKGGNRPNNQNGQPPRYRGKNIDMMGDPGRMKRHAIDVFRDISRGRYNTNNIAEFLNQEFIMAAITGAREQLRRHEILRNAIVYAYGASADPDVLSLRNQETVTCQGWELIINTLYVILNTQDLGTVYGLINRLSTNRDLRL